MVRTITGEDKKGRPKKGQKDTHPAGTKKKEGRELVPLLVGSYLTPGPFNATCMQRSIPILGYHSTLAISTHVCQIIN